jgi:hypothetical protein
MGPKQKKKKKKKKKYGLNPERCNLRFFSALKASEPGLKTAQNLIQWVERHTLTR